MVPKHMLRDQLRGKVVIIAVKKIPVAFPSNKRSTRTAAGSSCSRGQQARYLSILLCRLSATVVNIHISFFLLMMGRRRKRMHACRPWTMERLFEVRNNEQRTRTVGVGLTKFTSTTRDSQSREVPSFSQPGFESLRTKTTNLKCA